MRIDEESTEPLEQEQCERILKAYGDRLPQVDIVCLQDHDKGLLAASICRQMIELANEAAKEVLVDPSLIKDYSKYTGATVITPNRKETSAAVGFEITAGEDIVRAADELAEKLDIETVVITLDKEGAYLKTKQSSELIPTRPRSVYDVTGAGDMVLATLATALAAGCDCRTAVQLSNVAGGIVVEKFGAASATIEEMIAEIAGQDHGEGSKLLSVDCLVEALGWHRKGEKTIVFTNGCFDILHTGHVEYLDFAKAQGEILVIGLNSDASVRITKGPERPINGQDDRAAVLAALRSVDYIALFDEPTPLKLIERVKPDILVKGEDWADKGVVGREFVESRGGKVVLAPVVQGRSTTGTIEKIRGLGGKARRQQQ
jgi:D-beta-D-heptose 7-phosphate kinase/D-beta-D-heptose 1-phosphate adenosyltransferase